MKRTKTIVANLCRLLLAATFILSGFVKAVDPLGTQYKLHDYLEAMGMAGMVPDWATLTASVLLAAIEFSLGIHMLFAIRRRLMTRVVLAVMVVMTLLTVWIAIANPVKDCGCFGDAIVLTNIQTLGKNIVLLVCAVVTARWHALMPRLVSRSNQWIVRNYSALFVLAVSLISLYTLPIFDFRPYHTGADIRQGMEIPPGAKEPEFVTTFIMQKDGQTKEFTLDNYPDSTWQFVDSKTVQTAEGYVPPIHDFSIQLNATGDDITDEVLSNRGYTFLLIAPYLDRADDSNFGQIDQIYEYAQDHKVPFYCLTSSVQKDIDHWTDITGAEYPFCTTDATTLKTMIRSNPGLMLIKDGKVVRKWSHNRLPDTELMTASLDKLEIGHTPDNGTATKTLKIFLWYVLPLLLLTITDRMLAWSRWIRENENTHIIYKLFKRKKTMRKKIVAGNWKMNLNLQDGVALAKEINEAMTADKPNCDVVICTPFIHLASVAQVLNAEVVGLGAENCADKEKGAYTGEVSAEMVKSTGAQYVILGHSERRQYYGETAEILKEKVELALKNGLKVIFCCGETLEEREAEKQNEVVKAELEGSVFHLDAEAWKNIILAYEPIWAIGTGKTATSDQAEEMLAYIRSIVAEKYGNEAAEETSILYGGSCKASNAPELFAKPDIDGGLIGGASLKAADFKGIIDAWKK
ncbi:MAG: triose-phosphate isomerase [Prevotellaceae bacterium]|nr:triose-phosphate isomerase [Prevotellaceae bacterium]